jgi:nucleoside 2-deoxyribosyltransferase
MNYKNVYLAGKIENLTWEEAADWRNLTAARFEEVGIDCYNPCDHVPPELRNGIITTERVKSLGGFRGDELFTQDMFHLQNCNIFLLNLDDPGTGTLIELGMAYTLGLTIIGFGGSSDLKKHPFTYKTIQVMFDALEDAIQFIVDI